MRTLVRTLATFGNVLFWLSLGSLLIVAVAVKDPNSESFLSIFGAVLVGVASCLLNRSGG